MTRFRAHLAATEVNPVGARSVRMRVQVRNLSDRSWPANGPVFLAYQVLDETDGALLEEGERTPFGVEVPPGRTVETSLTLRLPSEEGTYRVLVSPVEEPVAWFYARGSDCLVLRVEINRAGVLQAKPYRLTSFGRHWELVRRRLGRLLVAPFVTVVRHRALIVSMVRRDVHGRYRGSMAGLFWTVIQPLLLMLTYFFVFALVLQVRFGPRPEESGPLDFLLYFICGILPWLAFSEALARAPSVLLEHRTLVTRVLFPVEILPINIAVGGLVSQFFALLVYLVGLIYLRGGIPATALLLPVVLIPPGSFDRRAVLVPGGVGRIPA